MTDRSHLSPEERASAEACDRLTDNFLEQTNGLPVGVVLGACMNVIRTAAQYLPADMRKILAERLRGPFAEDIETMQDASHERANPEPGSGSGTVH
jgi:hypothetical protein